MSALPALPVATSPSPRPTLTLAATFAAEPLLPLVRDALASVGAPHRVESVPYGRLFTLPRTGALGIGLVRAADWSAELLRQAREFTVAHGTPTVLVRCPEGAVPDGPGPATGTGTGPLAPGGDGARAQVPGLALFDAASWWGPSGAGTGGAAGPEAAGLSPDTARGSLAAGIARIVRSTLAPPRRVIAVECDRTLWGGACGKRPPAALELGARHLAVQRVLRRKREEGFTLVLCSQNDEADVERVFAERARDMPLSRGHFAASRVNWGPKSESLLSLAAELRLGPDSFVLVEDNPYVCAEVGAALPAVAVLRVGVQTDPAAVIADAWELDRFFGGSRGDGNGGGVSP
ncbi:HAD-IIIC family phosphatase [Streptomyces sp. NPDC051567]|uniref:HAD-IIIC family phosphatase n=1 Tax=Streptomyces sp. NPDC051567 TaxID=3365660 RepID=UPI00378771FF